MFEKETAQLQQELREIYKDLHRHPEIGFSEHRTAGIIAAFLRRCGIEVSEGIAITGVVGILDSGKPGKTVMLRADMDCLQVQELCESDWKSQEPGRMHACGHDAHVAMLLGAAKVLSQHREAFCGKIKFVFQPAEEETPAAMWDTVRAHGYNRSGGAGFMVEEGVLDGVDACVIRHVQPSLPTGTVSIARKNACASSDGFTITMMGKGGHGAQPQNAVDPVPAMAELISAIHILPTREVSALETCVISIGKVETPGSVWNAVAEKAIISGGFRTFNQNVRKMLDQRIEETAAAIAKAHRCSIQIDRVVGYMPCVNDETIARLVAESCTEILGEGHAILTDAPAMTSEDCSEYLSRVPGVFFWMGIGGEENAAALHNPYFKMDLEALSTGSLLHVNNALSLLNKLNG